MKDSIKVVIDYSTQKVKILNSRISNYDVLFEAYWDMQTFHVKVQRNLEPVEHIFTGADLKHFIINLNKKSDLNTCEDFILSYVSTPDAFLTLLLEQVSDLITHNSTKDVIEIIDDVSVETTVHLLSSFQYELEPCLSKAV